MGSSRWGFSIFEVYVVLMLTSAIFTLPNASVNPESPISKFSSSLEMETFAKKWTSPEAEPQKGPMVFKSAGQLMDLYSPADLVTFLEKYPLLLPGSLQILEQGLRNHSSSYRNNVEQYYQNLLIQAGRELQRGQLSLGEYFSYLLLNPQRFFADGEFRRHVFRLLPMALPAELSQELKDQILAVLIQFPGISFDMLEPVETVWSTLPRRSNERRKFLPHSNDLPTMEGNSEISLSLYSLPSQSFSYDEAAHFLLSVMKTAPNRRLVVMSDLNLYEPFQDFCDAHNIALIKTHGRHYSPWPRDPLLFFKAENGGVVILQRPNSQASREMDEYMAREFVRGLPDILDCEWGPVQWGRAATPFHNGKILMASDRVWINLDTVEIRALQILGLRRVPVASFQTHAGIDAYLDAANQAADELADLFGKPVAFIDPLPWQGELNMRSATMNYLGGGAGYDLDSLVTLLPHKQKGMTAFIGDVNLATELITQTSSADWQKFTGAYRLQGPQEAIRRSILNHQSQRRATSLGQYLDLVAGYLQARGVVVERLPLFLVPQTLVEGRQASRTLPDFLITWTNVVLEQHPATLSAEGFRGMLPLGDRHANEIFGKHGVQLKYLPPLLDSIYRMGGYRCASKHLRL